MKKYWKTHDYDPVFVKYFDKNKEKEFQELRKIQESKHGKDFEKKLPPSYVYREGYMPDPSKPVPDALKTL